MADYAEIYNRLTNEFFQEFLEKHEGENIVFSPFSILSLLALGANSTSGATRDEILKAVSEGLGIEDLNALVAELQGVLTEGKGFNSSSAAIARASLKNTIKPGYEEKINEILGASLISSENIVDDVNAWVSEKTDGMIKEIADDSMANMLASLINAVIFDSPWLKQHDEDDIGEGEFTNADGSVSEVTTLSRSEQGYIENEFFTGFEKPYQNGYSFVGLLPKKKKSKSFIKRAVAELDFSKLLDSAEGGEVFVEMPEFTFEFQENLNEVCKKFGIKELFENNADFSEMTTSNIKVDSIIHKARIELDRKGTKAAAASMMVCVAGCAPMDFKSVILDRPFVYGIVNHNTGLPVFVGMVNKL